MGGLGAVIRSAEISLGEALTDEHLHGKLLADSSHDEKARDVQDCRRSSVLALDMKIHSVRKMRILR